MKGVLLLAGTIGVLPPHAGPTPRVTRSHHAAGAASDSLLKTADLLADMARTVDFTYGGASR